MKRRTWGTALFLVALAAIWLGRDALFQTEQLNGAMARAIDGDSLIVDGRTVRLAGIDAPEYRQSCATRDGMPWPCGRAARAQLEALALAGPVICEVIARDRYDRAIATCSTPATPDLGAAMTVAGLVISPAERGEARYAAEQEVARDARRGLWQGEFDTPAQWRAAHPRRTAIE